jgi:hypothetical protein
MINPYFLIFRNVALTKKKRFRNTLVKNTLHFFLELKILENQKVKDRRNVGALQNFYFIALQMGGKSFNNFEKLNI